MKKMLLINLIRRKLNADKGETLLESLTALLIICFSIISLVTCILTAAKINKKTADLDYSFTPAIEAQGTQNVKISDGVMSDINIEVDRYVTKNGYQYYEEKAGGD